MTGRAWHHERDVWTVRDVVGVLALVALAFLVTWNAWRDILWIAIRDEEESHIFLVPIIAIWLVWVRRARLRKCPRDGRLIGPLVVLVGWVLFSLGDLRSIQAFWHFGAILVVVGGFLSFAGIRYLVRLLPAFVVLVFLVPVPGVVRHEIAEPLQSATAEATQRLLDVLGVEAYRAGNALVVNGREIFIAEACNGLRMVFALFLVSFTFAYSTPIREPVRLLILALSPVTAILCNVVRLVPTVWVYGTFSEAVGERVHSISGWVMLPIAFLLLLGIFRLLRWALVPVYRYTLAYGK